MSEKPLAVGQFSLFSGMENDTLMHREGLKGYRRQILTTKVDPRAVRINIFLMAVDT